MPALGYPPCPWGDHRRTTVGLLGGSFNPAHAGHRHISVEALKRLGLDEVWWLVSPQNPLKASAGMAPLAVRLEHARRVAAHPRIRVSALEARLGSTYTADLLAALPRRFPQARFVWLMGADNLVQIPRWKAWQSIFSRTPVAILDRGTYAKQALTGKAAQRFAAARLPAHRARALAGEEPPAWVFLPIRRHAASATDIRARRDQGQPGGWYSPG
ncbi:nicotinate-nucleotide adenylyltransferase [Novispirillum sp. DQ9]|uniref:nicotinate-nucleotide adenylyltransferase n=1 Tax=Novispirillum sp. DQ9 TaxID=3398612 RepID=UPI003C7D76DB